MLDYWPLVLVDFRGRQTAADVEYYIGRQEEALARQEHFATLTMMSSYSRDKGLAKRIGYWLKERRDEIRRRSVGGAMVATSPAFRFLLSTVFLIQPLPVPYTVVTKYEDALRWADERLQTVGLRAPSGLWGPSPPPIVG